MPAPVRYLRAVTRPHEEPLRVDVAVVGRRRRGPVRGTGRRRTGRSRRARQPLPARADRKLLGPGRDRRRAGRRRLARATRRRHAQAQLAAVPARAQCRCCANNRRTRCASWSGWACASTPTATAPSRSASRAGTRAAVSCTPAARQPAGGSRASCRRWQRCTSGYDVLEDATAAALWTDGERCIGLLAVSARADQRCRCSHARRCSPRAAWQPSGSAPPTRPVPSARAWRWPTPQARSWPTSSSCNSTRRRCARPAPATAS